MTKGWIQTTLNDVTSLLGDGLHGTPKYDEKGEYYFINGNNLQNGKVIIKGDTKRISEDEYQKIKKNLNDRTILVAINGTLGNVGIYRGEKIALGKSACYFNVNQDIEKQFIKYIIESPLFQMYAPLFATGSTIKNLSLRAIRNFSFLLPPLPTQQKIAAILSAYDDLIENNLQRIKLLEEMAQITYEEWFVRMKFPGHEHTPIDSETDLPVGWRKAFLKDVTVYINRGIAPKYVSAEGISVINQKCIRNHDINFSKGRLTASDHKVPKDKFLNPLDILVNSTGTGTLGRVAQLFDCSTKSTVDTHVTIVRASRDISPYILGRCLESLEPFIESLGKGATNQQELGRADLANIVQIAIPDRALMAQYDEIANPIFQTVTNLRSENNLLKEARDILLPRLMTGMIDVDAIELPEALLARIDAEDLG